MSNVLTRMFADFQDAKQVMDEFLVTQTSPLDPDDPQASYLLQVSRRSSSHAHVLSAPMHVSATTALELGFYWHMHALDGLLATKYMDLVAGSRETRS
jgi:hypothetical protein